MPSSGDDLGNEVGLATRVMQVMAGEALPDLPLPELSLHTWAKLVETDVRPHGVDAERVPASLTTGQVHHGLRTHAVRYRSRYDEAAY